MAPKLLLCMLNMSLWNSNILLHTNSFIQWHCLSCYCNYCFFQFHYRFLLPHIILNAIALIALVTRCETQ